MIKFAFPQFLMKQAFFMNAFFNFLIYLRTPTLHMETACVKLICTSSLLSRKVDLLKCSVQNIFFHAIS